MDSSPNGQSPTGQDIPLMVAGGVEKLSIKQKVNLDMMDLIDFDNAIYIFQGIGFNFSNGHTEFIFKVTAPNGVAFNISDRYSSIRAFYEVIK